MTCRFRLCVPGYRSPIPDRFQWRAWAADPEDITGETLMAFINDELFPALKNLQMTGQSGDRRRVVHDVFEDAYNYMKSGQLVRPSISATSTNRFSTTCNRPATLANTTRRVPSLPSWSIV